MPDQSKFTGHPMTRAFTRSELRDVDHRAIRDFQMTGLVLMENAGRGAADLLRARGPLQRVVVCCGKGNNGGDGFVIARHLEAAGIDVHVILLAEAKDLSGDAAANFRILQAAGTPLTALSTLGVTERRSMLQDADWIVDALLGTGLSSDVREPYATMIRAMNDSGRSILAVDLPSGMDCDSGQPLGACVTAKITATFVALKTGFDRPGADELTGEVVVLPIGVPRPLLQAGE